MHFRSLTYKTVFCGTSSDEVFILSNRRGRDLFFNYIYQGNKETKIVMRNHVFVFVCVKWCPTHIVLCLWCFSFVCVRSMLPVSLDRPFLIAPSVFSNV